MCVSRWVEVETSLIHDVKPARKWESLHDEGVAGGIVAVCGVSATGSRIARWIDLHQPPKAGRVRKIAISSCY